MKDLILILVMAAVFAFGYYIMTRVDRFTEENQRMISHANRQGQCPVRIAAEHPMLLGSVTSALENCSRADPHIAFFLSSGRAAHLLEKLLDEQIDIVLLSDTSSDLLSASCTSLLLPRENKAAAVSILGLPVEPLEDDARVRVVWKKQRRAKDRDRVIFAMENEYCSLKCGYADYLD